MHHETCVCEQCARDNALKRDAAKLQDFNATLAARVAELEAEDAGLRKDKARLDWMLADVPARKVYVVEHDLDTGKRIFRCRAIRAETPRAAIDGAMGLSVNIRN